MGIQDIPIVALGPGSQPEESDGARLEYLHLPKNMRTYEKPSHLGEHDIAGLAAAREAVDWLRFSMSHYRTGVSPRIANLSHLDAANRRFMNDLLGEGEVSVNYSGSFNARAQEAVLAGVWRCHYLNHEGQVTHDLLEVGDVPHLVRTEQPTQLEESPVDVEAPPDVVNAQSILAELRAHADSYRVGDPPHVINLTLLPMSDGDLAFLEQSLGWGPVEILSRSYGMCRMSSTARPRVWWVRYYNSTETLILNTLEVVDVPLVARAAEEDIADSHRRLEEIVESEGLVAPDGQ